MRAGTHTNAEWEADRSNPAEDRRRRRGRAFAKHVVAERETETECAVSNEQDTEERQGVVPKYTFRTFRRRIRALRPPSSAVDRSNVANVHVERKSGSKKHWHLWRNHEGILVMVVKKVRSKRSRRPRKDESLQQWSRFYVPLSQEDFVQALAKERSNGMPCTRARLHCLALVLCEYITREEETTEMAVRKAFGDTPEVSKALRLLVSKNQLLRRGQGGRRDPFRYRTKA